MPVEPKQSANGLGMDAMRERDYMRHRERVANQRSCIDNSAPASCAYTRPVRSLDSAGGATRNKYRQQQIERDNQKLVERMVYIMQTGGSVDNREPWREPKKAAKASQYKRSTEQQRIAQENAKLLERLEAAQPTYQTHKFEADRTRNEEIAARISRYPYQPLDQTEYGTLSRTDVL